MWKLALILGLISTPALAAHTKDAVVYDSKTKIVLMVVVPTDDKELNDSAYNLKGTVQIQVPHVEGKGYSDQIDEAINQVIDIKGPRQLTDNKAEGLLLSFGADDTNVSLTTLKGE